MNYSTIFAATCSAERLSEKIFSVEAAIAISVFTFELACDAVESGMIVRGWYESVRAWWDESGRDCCALELAPCIAAASAAVAWCFGVDRCWSVQRLPITLAANAEFWADVKADYLAVGDRAVRFVDQYLMGV